jgi:1-acyl-sn-glycerol-3-phosphate acyltransferase
MARSEVPSPADLERFERAIRTVPARQGRFERLLRVVIRMWCRLVAWRLRIAGLEQLPVRDGVLGAGCVVAAAPHRAWVEPFLLFAAWPPDAARLVWLADGRTATRSWWRRWLLPRLGVIPIASASAGPRAYSRSVALVCERGGAVAVFPEVGAPSPPDRTRRISAGFAYLALAARAPVLPVAIGGTHRIVRGSAFTVDVLAPLDPGDPLVDPFAPPGRARAHELRAQLQAAIASALPARTAQADAAAPERERWRWLGALFD